MNINFSQFAIQCAAMGLWVLMAAGLYAIIGKSWSDKYYPGLLDIEAEGASQAPGPVGDDVPRRPRRPIKSETGGAVVSAAPPFLLPAYCLPLLSRRYAATMSGVAPAASSFIIDSSNPPSSGAPIG